MKALILAAGRGSRMSNETDHKPKCLVEINGKTLLKGLCDNFEQNNLQEIYIVTGYLEDKVYDKRILKKIHNANWSQTNMVASMLEAKDLFEGDDVLVTYSDIFYNSDILREIIHSGSSYDVAISYDPNFLGLWERRFTNPIVDLETFRMDSKGFLQEIGNKPMSTGEIQGQYMGILLFKKNSWPRIYSEIIRSNYEKLSMTEVLNNLIKKDFKIRAIPYRGIWGEIDTVSDKILFNKINK